MRTPREIAFRLRQEISNLRLLLSPPAFHGAMPATPLPGLPDPRPVAERLRGTPYAARILELADEVLQNRIPLFDTFLDAGPEIDWRRDWRHGRSTGLSYFRCIPYLDFERAGDHKAVWELNRHQHLVLLAQAWRLTGDARYPAAIGRHLSGWLDANPFQRGINWTSALEAAFRALSWIWTWHLAGDAVAPELGRRWLESLYRHGHHLETNLSIYFSPNTHLLGEAVALHALGSLFEFPESARWRRRGGEVARAQMHRQVCPDGSHFERSVFYHVYALDFFLLLDAVEPQGPEFRGRLGAMAEFLDAVCGASRRLPDLGDSDGGRVFHPYGDRALFGRATLAAAGWNCEAGDAAEMAAWWRGVEALDRRPEERAPRRGRLFADSGIAIMTHGEAQVVVDAGPFGKGSAGHSHSDTLSVIVRRGGEELLRDAGTFEYMGTERWRDWFRGSPAHNTVRVDERDQAAPRGPFAWEGRPEVRILERSGGGELDYLDAECRYPVRGGMCRHRRRVALRKPGLLAILDTVEGPPGEHVVEQFWHPAAGAALYLTGEAEEEEGGTHGWHSPVYGRRNAAPVVRVRRVSALPVRLAAVVDLERGRQDIAARLETVEGADVLVWGTRRIVFPASGPPVEEGAG